MVAPTPALATGWVGSEANETSPYSMRVVRNSLAAVLALALIGCTGSGDRSNPTSSVPTSSGTIEPATQVASTPVATALVPTQAPIAESSPLATPMPSARATLTPTSAPTAEPTSLAECEAATDALLDAEDKALAAAAAIDDFLSGPIARGVATVPAELPEPELDGSHVNQYQTLARIAGLTDILMSEEEWEAVVGWQQAWAVAESFGDNPELWDAAAEAVMEVFKFMAEKLPDPPVGIGPRIVVSAADLASWRAAWLSTLAATNPADMVSAHVDALYASSFAFTMATLGSGENGITEEQFTGSLDDALEDRLDAARKLQRWGC